MLVEHKIISVRFCYTTFHLCFDIIIKEYNVMIIIILNSLK